jgi:high-affinity iron transporter
LLSAFLITLREGLEAALVVGIILAYLNRTGNRASFKPVWTGVALAVVASLVAGTAIYFLAGELTGRAEEIFEGIAMFLAVGVLTWMIFWMAKQSANIRQHLQAQVDSAVTAGSALGLVLLTFVVVVREGVETALFLFATTRMEESAMLSAVGALLGMALAVGIGYSIYRGATRLNLRAFFNVTSLLLIVFAAGLLAHGIHEFQEAGIIPIVVEHVWDVNDVIPEKSTVGRFLTAVVGYNGNPSLIEVVAYVVFLVSVLLAYIRAIGTRKPVGAVAGT